MPNVERMSYGYIDQTCPIVDGLTATCLELIQADLDKILDGSNHDPQAIGDAVEYRVETLIGKIKQHVTEKFRVALMDCCSDLRDMESERDHSERNYDRMENERDSLVADVEYYQNEVARLSDEMSSM